MLKHQQFQHNDKMNFILFKTLILGICFSLCTRDTRAASPQQKLKKFHKTGYPAIIKNNKKNVFTNRLTKDDDDAITYKNLLKSSLRLVESKEKDPVT